MISLKVMNHHNSITRFDHDRVEILKTYFSVIVAVSLFQHQSQGFLIHVFLDMIVYLMEIF
jgi:hypothetical protein